MLFMIFAGILALVFGILLFIAPESIQNFCQRCDEIIFTADLKLQPHRLWVGIFLIAVSIWMFLIDRNPALYLILKPIAILAFVFGFLYLAFPGWLDKLSGVMNRNVLPTNVYIMKVSRTIGAVLVAASAYLFYTAYAVR